MRHPTDDAKALTAVGALVLAQALVVLAFVLPAHAPEPHDVPVGVVGPAAAAQALEARAPGAFAARAYASPDAARAAILDREVYGALVPPGPGGERAPTVLVASAASPAVAGLLREAAGPEAAVRDLVPLDAGDPRGATLNLLFLPLILACLPAALVLSRLVPGAAGLLGALALFAAAGGTVVVALVAGAVGALPGPALALAGVAALTVLAIALPTAGLLRLLGPPGAGLAALLFLLIGNPGSGNATAPELLPGFWRAVGPLLPPGAGGDALRGTAYFDGAAAGAPLLVLVLWAAAGAILLGAGTRRGRPAR